MEIENYKPSPSIQYRIFVIPIYYAPLIYILARPENEGKKERKKKREKKKTHTKKLNEKNMETLKNRY